MISEESLVKGEKLLYRASYAYNANGFLTEKEEFLEGTEEVSLYEYDALGRLVKSVYPDGETEWYEIA